MKGDKKIIEILNDLLAGELTAVDQYLIHGEMYADMGFQRLADKALHESDHERQHARALSPARDQQGAARGHGLRAFGRTGDDGAGTPPRLRTETHDGFDHAGDIALGFDRIDQFFMDDWGQIHGSQYTTRLVK